MSRKDYENGEKTYRSRIKICSACLLLVIFEESWFRCSMWEVMPTISYRWLLSRNQEDRFETKYGTFIITNHWFSNRLFPFRARKNSIRKNKHRQQRNVNETETSPLHWFFRDRNSDIRRDEDTIQNLDHTTTLLDITHAFCHRCALSCGSLTTDPRTIRREILFPVAKSINGLVRSCYGWNLCIKRLMLTFTIMFTTQAAQSTELVKGDWGSDRLCREGGGFLAAISLLHKCKELHRTPLWADSAKSRKVLNEPWDWLLVGELEK